MDSVVHFEIPTENLEWAEQFYTKVFGWKSNIVPGLNYALVETTPTNEQHQPTEPGAINGGLLKRKALLNTPVITINVESIDKAIQAIEAAGGRIVLPKQAVGIMGYTAYFEDTEDNVIGLWENAK